MAGQGQGAEQEVQGEQGEEQVQLAVRQAAGQDVRVACGAAWTVRRLKLHLQRASPQRPKVEDQKIIYSGQLLDDNTVLKDVLRVYEGQEAHTLHLVCTPKSFKMPETNAPPSEVNEGLRRRTVTDSTPQPQAPPRQDARQNNQNHTMEMQNVFTNLVNNYGRVPLNYTMSYGGLGGYYPVPNDPVAVANHVMMMQQAYMQYMQQYANMWQAGGAEPVVHPPNEAPQQAVPEPPLPEALDDENEPAVPRDWLDWLYAISRMAILFSLVYLYSSPFRFLLVLLLAFAGYLYQLGFFRDLGIEARNERNQEARPNPIPNQMPPQPQPNPEPNAAEPTSGAATNNDPSNTDPLNNQSLLSFTRMVFTSFFTSLIPETPTV